MKLATSMMLQSQCHGLSSRMTTGMLTTSSPLTGSSGSTSLVVIKFLRVSLEMVCRLLCERSSVLSFGNEVKLLIENSEMLFQLDSNRGCFKMTPCSRDWWGGREWGETILFFTKHFHQILSWLRQQTNLLEASHATMVISQIKRITTHRKKFI